MKYLFAALFTPNCSTENVGNVKFQIIDQKIFQQLKKKSF